jgi:glycosyltransferase involved in cell wall biosynthesis
MGLDRNVHWVGRIPHEELPAYLNAATVFVTVPSVDATAVSLLEAMACRCAVVATALPSALEWIRHEVTGLAVPPRNGDALVAAVTRLIGAPRLRDRLGEAAESEVRARADHDRNMGRVEAIYRSLVEGRLPAPASPEAVGRV